MVESYEKSNQESVLPFPPHPNYSVAGQNPSLFQWDTPVQIMIIRSLQIVLWIQTQITNPK
jgi:hypothetical protein